MKKTVQRWIGFRGSTAIIYLWICVCCLSGDGGRVREIKVSKMMSKHYPMVASSTETRKARVGIGFG